MDRRRERRFEYQGQAVVTTLDGPGQTIQATISNISGRGMQLELPVELSTGTAIQVEWDDILGLGEVCYCQRTVKGTFLCGVELDQAITRLAELIQLQQALLGDPVPPLKVDLRR